MRRRTGGLDERSLVDLIERIYAAATEPGGWSPLLEQVSVATGSKMGAIHLQDLATGQARFLGQHGLDPTWAELDYQRYFAPRNVYMQACAPLMTTGFVTAGERHVPDREVMRTEYFNDYLRRGGVLHNVGACIVRKADTVATLTVLREIGGPEYSDEDLRLVQRLMPHLHRALRVSEQLEAALGVQRVAEEALDRLPVGFVVLGGDGRILFANRVADRILAQADGLRVQAGRLTAERPWESRRLAQLVASACMLPATRLDAAAERGGVIRLARPSGRRAYSVMVAPMREDPWLMLSAAPSAVVFVSDPDARPETAIEVLQGLYDLTPAEARLVERLLAGDRLEEAADRLGTMMNTVRTHLKRIFAKTETRSQGDLLRVLMLGPGWLTHRLPTGRTGATRGPR